MSKAIIIYNVRAYRERKGWSLRKLALVSGVSASHLSLVEKNEAHLTVPAIWDLADALGCDPKDLYERM